MSDLYRRIKKDPCLEEDCSEVVSPCCGVVVDMVFGSLPLEVQCSVCGKTYVLRNLIK